MTGSADEELEPYTVEDAADDLVDWIAAVWAEHHERQLWDELGRRPVWRLLRVLLLREYRRPR